MSDEAAPDPTADSPTRARGLSPRQALFLEAFSVTGTVSGAAKRSGVHRSMHYDWLQDPTYTEGFKDAERMAADALVTEARRRALEGTEKPVFQGGTQVGTIVEYSDRLLELLLRGALPAIYRESAKQADPDAAPLDMGISERQRQLLMDELDAMEANATAPG